VGATVQSGIPELDRAWPGLLPGDLMVVSAGSGIGKTALAVRVALHASKDQRLPVLFLSGQHAAEEITERILVGLASVETIKVRRRIVSPAERSKLSGAAQALALTPLRIEAPDNLEGRGLQRQLEFWARSAWRDLPGLIVIDGLGGRTDPVREGTTCIDSLSAAKEIAARFFVPIMVTLGAATGRGPAHLQAESIRKSASVHVRIRRNPRFGCLDEQELARLDVMDWRSGARVGVRTPFSRDLSWFTS